MNLLKFNRFFREKIIRGRKPWSVASDFIFVLLVVMLLIPSTRGFLMAQAAGLRSLLTNPEIPVGERPILDPESWNWELTDLNGTTVSFASFRGEVIFLNQWATWCPPCRAEMPSIEKLWKAYGDRVKFVILTSEEPMVVRNYLSRHGYTFPVYLGRAQGRALSASTIPATVIIGRGGEVIVNRTGAYNWASGRVRRLLTGETI